MVSGVIPALFKATVISLPFIVVTLKCFDFLKGIPDIEGAMAVLDGRIALWGDVPKIVKCEFDPDLITRGK